jgi:hypothetical protein
MVNQENMKLAIYDKGGGRFSSSARTSAVVVFGKEAVPEFDPVVDEAVKSLCTFSHIVCHLNSKKEEKPSWTDLMTSDLTAVKVIIRVSSQGASGMSDSFKSPYRHNGTSPWILHLIQRSVEVTALRWNEIFKVINDWDTDKEQLSRDVAAIFDPHPEARLALRLLCEAWLMNRDRTDTSKVNASQDHHGITVHAPTTPDQWFGVFVEGFNGLDAKKRKETSESAATEIAAHMGGARAGVATFLAKLTALYAGSAHSAVARPTFEVEIESLVEQLKSADAR